MRQRLGDSSSSSSSTAPEGLKARLLQGIPKGRAAVQQPNSSSSSKGSLRTLPAIGSAAGVLVARQHLLGDHPRVRQLRATDVAKLVTSCCLAGWAPPQLFTGGDDGLG